jgi:mRNA interferase RelE/StbE
MYRLALAPKAARMFESADRPFQRKLDKCFQNISVDPFRHPNVKSLTGPLRGMFRYRVGDYRVVYEVDRATSTVNVVAIVHRRDAYR